jgi:tetratricopeptide (TPR) repeat protein
MKSLAFFFLISLSFGPAFLLAQKNIQRGYVCLERKDFGSAERAFRKAVIKDPERAYLGLALLFSASMDYKNLDSALVFIEKALFYTEIKGEKEKNKNNRSKDSSYFLSAKWYRNGLETCKTEILLKYYADLRVSSADWITVEEVLPHCSMNPTEEAFRRLRDSLFLGSTLNKTPYTYWSLLQRKPSVYWKTIAEDEFQRLTYLEWVSSSKEENLVLFLRFNQLNKYVEWAEEEVFKGYTQDKDTLTIQTFINKYPRNPHVDRAWKMYFQLACWGTGGSESSVRAFLHRNPGYPFKGQALEDLEFMERRLIPSLNEQGLLGFMDEQGHEVIPCQFETVGEFIEGLSTVSVNDQYGVIDKKGGFRLPCRYGFLSDYQNNAFIAQEDSQFVLINAKGENLLSHPFTDLSWIFRDKLLFRNEALFGVMEIQGNVVLDPFFDEITPINDYFALVSVNDKVGVINSVGDYLVAPEYDQIEYSNALFVVTKSNRKGIIKESGELLLPVEYDEIGEVRDLLIYIAKAGQFTHLNPVSKKISKYKYPTYAGSNRLGRFIQGTFIVRQGNGYVVTDTLLGITKLTSVKSIGNPGEILPIMLKSDGAWSLLNRKGEAVMETYAFDFVRNLSDSLFIVSVQGKMGVLSSKGVWVINPTFDDILWEDDETFMVLNNGKKGVYASSGKCLVPCDYEQIFKYSVHHWGLLNNLQFSCFLVDSSKIVIANRRP